MTEAEAFFAKAEESLASAEDDYAKERYNACARNTYYAAFQAAVAALLSEGIVPAGRWEHEFVRGRFSGMLVRRRKLYPTSFGAFLTEAFNIRVRADYSGLMVGQRSTRSLIIIARKFVRQVEGRIHGNR